MIEEVNNFKWSVGARALLGKLKNGRYKTVDDIEADIAAQHKELDTLKRKLVDQFNKRLECIHVYGDAVFTIRRNIFDYTRFNERSCKNCTMREVVAEREGVDRPEWAVNATESYYNNNI